MLFNINILFRTGLALVVKIRYISVIQNNSSNFPIYFFHCIYFFSFQKIKRNKKTILTCRRQFIESGLSFTMQGYNVVKPDGPYLNFKTNLISNMHIQISWATRDRPSQKYPCALIIEEQIGSDHPI